MTSPDSVFLQSLLWQGCAVQYTCAADLERSLANSLIRDWRLGGGVLCRV
jgi:hypothetical protein